MRFLMILGKKLFEKVNRRQMKTKYIIIFLIVLFLGGVSCRAEKAGSVFKADQLYLDKDYQGAIENYKEVEKSQGTSPDFLYNMGNAYVLNGDLGHGRLCYERGRRLAPGNKAINNNLTYVANKVNDANEASRQGNKINVSPDELSFFAGVDRAISYNRTSNFWSVYAILSFLLLLSSIALYLFTSNVNARKVGFFGGLIFLFFSVVFVIFSFMAARAFERHDEAVLMEYKTELRSEPSDDSKPVGTPLNQGTKFRIIETEDDGKHELKWVKVRLNANFEGWIKSSEIEVI